MDDEQGAGYDDELHGRGGNGKNSNLCFELTQASCWITAGLAIAVPVYKGQKFSALKLGSEKFIAVFVLGTYCLLTQTGFQVSSYTNIFGTIQLMEAFCLVIPGVIFCVLSLSLSSFFSERMSWMEHAYILVYMVGWSPLISSLCWTRNRLVGDDFEADQSEY